MTFALPDDLRAAIHRGDPLLSIARTYGVPIDRLLAYARALRGRPALRTPEGRAAFLQASRPKQLEMTLAYALERMQSPDGPADLRALERLLLQAQHHIDRWHDLVARQQREHKESRREAIRRRLTSTTSSCSNTRSSAAPSATSSMPTSTSAPRSSAAWTRPAKASRPNECPSPGSNPEARACYSASIPIPPARSLVRLYLFSALATLVAVSLFYTSGRAAPADKPFGLDQRVPWTTSRLQGSPDPPPPYRLTRVFPQISFKGPVFIAQDPLSDRLFVAEYDGRIYSFLPGDPAGKKDLFLDMGRGISAFSFHPKYKENGYVFVFSHADTKLPSRTNQKSKVSRYQPRARKRSAARAS